MTEQEWLTGSDPSSMLRFLGFQNDALSRKMRLFAVGCCRCRWADLQDLKYRQAVEIAELFAEGKRTQDELIDAWEDARTGFEVWEQNDCAAQAAIESATPAWLVGGGPGGSMDALAASGVIRANLLAPPESASLLRDIFGNPFRPATVSAAWQTANVVSLAQAIYDERAFDRIPILGDALEDAGCDNADILNHCRQPGEHVRGCWVVDLVLGKS